MILLTSFFLAFSTVLSIKITSASTGAINLENKLIVQGVSVLDKLEELEANINVLIDDHRYQIGDVLHSLLDETQFQALHGTSWVLMDGRSLTESIPLRALTGMTNLPDPTDRYFILNQKGTEIGNSVYQSTALPTSSFTTTTQSASHHHLLSSAYATASASGGSHYHDASGGDASIYIGNSGSHHHSASRQLKYPANDVAVGSVIPRIQGNLEWADTTDTSHTHSNGNFGGHSRSNSVSISNSQFSGYTDVQHASHSHTVTSGGDSYTRPNSVRVNAFVKIM